MSGFAIWFAGLDPTWRLLLLLPVLVAVAGIARSAVFFASFASLILFWVVLSGHFTPFLLAAGVGCVAAVLLLSRRMEVVDREGVPVDFVRGIVTYWPWLMKEIAKSAWDVTRIILDPRLPVSPAMVRIRPSQRSVPGLVIHANSITLTPGTITVEAGRDEFLVHGLTTAGAHGTIDSEMDRRVTALESVLRQSDGHRSRQAGAR